MDISNTNLTGNKVGILNVNDKDNVIANLTIETSGRGTKAPLGVMLTHNLTVNEKFLFQASSSTGPAGLIDGPKDLIIKGGFTWFAGAMQGTGKTIVEKSLTIKGNQQLAQKPGDIPSAFLVLNRTLVVEKNAKATVTGGAAAASGVYILVRGQGVIDNYGTFTLQNNIRFIRPLQVPLTGLIGQIANSSGTFINEKGATFEVTPPATGAAPNVSTPIEIAFNNEGTVVADNGTITFLGGGTSSGVFARDFNGDQEAAYVFTSLAGQPQALYTFNAGMRMSFVGSTSTVVLSNAKFYLPGPGKSSVALGRFTLTGGATISGPGNLSADQIAWINGTISGSGWFFIDATGLNSPDSNAVKITAGP